MIKSAVTTICAGKLTEDSMEEGSSHGGVAPRHFKNKLEEAITAKQESEAKVATLEDKVKQYEAELTDMKTKVGDNFSTVAYILEKYPNSNLYNYYPCHILRFISFVNKVTTDLFYNVSVYVFVCFHNRCLKD